MVDTVQPSSEPLNLLTTAKDSVINGHLAADILPEIIRLAATPTPVIHSHGSYTLPPSTSVLALLCRVSKTFYRHASVILYTKVAPRDHRLFIRTVTSNEAVAGLVRHLWFTEVEALAKDARKPPPTSEDPKGYLRTEEIFTLLDALPNLHYLAMSGSALVVPVLSPSFDGIVMSKTKGIQNVKSLELIQGMYDRSEILDWGTVRGCWSWPSLLAFKIDGLLLRHPQPKSRTHHRIGPVQAPPDSELHSKIEKMDLGIVGSATPVVQLITLLQTSPNLKVVDISGLRVSKVQQVIDVLNELEPRARSFGCGLNLGGDNRRRLPTDTGNQAYPEMITALEKCVSLEGLSMPGQCYSSELMIRLPSRIRTLTIQEGHWLDPSDLLGLVDPKSKARLMDLTRVWINNGGIRWSETAKAEVREKFAAAGATIDGDAVTQK